MLLDGFCDSILVWCGVLFIFRFFFCLVCFWVVAGVLFYGVVFFTVVPGCVCGLLLFLLLLLVRFIWVFWLVVCFLFLWCVLTFSCLCS